MRLDADEIVSEELAAQIRDRLPGLAADIDGVIVGRRMAFLGQPIRWGGLFPTQMLRLMRPGRGRCENRWMDEHLIVEGKTVTLSAELLDDNLKSLTWWTEKHNSYASREVVDILNAKYDLFPSDTLASSGGRQAGIKRFLKEQVYARFPVGLRALLYFLYRYVVRLGFLDGWPGFAFHLLQGFWYRFLVDAKLREVETYISAHQVAPTAAIKTVLGVDLDQRAPDAGA
jgi:hypothetical protein